MRPDWLELPFRQVARTVGRDPDLIDVVSAVRDSMGELCGRIGVLWGLDGEPESVLVEMPQGFGA